MKRYFHVVLTVVLFTAACGRSNSEAPATEVTQQVSQTPVAEDAGGQDVLRIETEMLRDLKVTTARVEARPGGQGAMLLGEIRVNENAYAEVGPSIPGRVISLLASSGQVVSAGQALALLQSAELGRARSELLSAEARLALARQTLDRKRRLASERIVAQRDVQEAEAGVASIEAEAGAARAALRSMGAVPGETGENSDSSVIALRTPLTGTVIERLGVVGQVADPEHPLFRIGDLSVLWLTVHAFERDAIRINAGAPARITFPALPGRAFTGRVDLVGNQVSLESRTLPIRIIVRNGEGLLRPGMSATAWVTPGGEVSTVLAVPTAALQRVEENWVVFIPREEGTFEIRTVGRGRDLGGEVEILSGLQGGETVVVEGAFLLKAEAEKSRSEGEQHEH